MAWNEIMTSTHSALARAEWALEPDTPQMATQELRTARSGTTKESASA